MRIAGTPQNITIAGVSFDVPADVNFKIFLSRYKSEVIVTSGANLRKMIKQATSITDLTIIGDNNEFDLLRTIAESREDVTMTIVLADGTSFTAEGFINFREVESSEYKAMVDLFPRDLWTPLIAA